MKEFSEMKATNAADKAKATSDLKKSISDDAFILNNHVTNKETLNYEDLKSTLDRFLKNLETFNTPDSNSQAFFIKKILPNLKLSDKDLASYTTQAAKYGNWALVSALTNKISEADQDSMPALSDLLHEATKSKQIDIVENLLSKDVKFSRALTSDMQTTLEQAAKKDPNTAISKYTEEQMNRDNLTYSVDNLDAFKSKLTLCSTDDIKNAYELALQNNNYKVLEAFHAAAQNISYFTKIQSALPDIKIELMMSESKIQQELNTAIANKQWDTVEALQKQGYAIKLPLDEKTATDLRSFAGQESSHPITAEFYKKNENKILKRIEKTTDELKAMMISALDQKKPNSKEIKKIVKALEQRISEEPAPTVNMHEILKGKLTNNIINYLTSNDKNLPYSLSTYVLSDEFKKECFSNPMTLEHALSIRDKKIWLQGVKLDDILKQAIEDKNTELLEKILKLSDKPAISSVLETNIVKILSTLPNIDSKKTKEIYDLILSDQFKKNTGLTDLNIATQVLISNNQELIANFISHVGTEKFNQILLNNALSADLQKGLNSKTKNLLFNNGIKWDMRLDQNSMDLFKYSTTSPDLFLNDVNRGIINVNAKSHQGTPLIDHVLQNPDMDSKTKKDLLLAMINKGADLSVFKGQEAKIGQLHEATKITKGALTFLSNTPALKEKLFSTDPKERQSAAEHFIDLANRSELLTPDINHKVTLNGDTMLHIAAYKNDQKLTDHLLEKGANLDVANVHGETPLFWAAKHGGLSKTMSEKITPKIANYKNTDGLTALDIALEAGNEKDVLLLIEKGANKFSEKSEKYLDKIESPTLKAMLASCKDGNITDKKKKEYKQDASIIDDIASVSPLAATEGYKNYFEYVAKDSKIGTTSANAIITLMDHPDYQQEAHQKDLETYLEMLPADDILSFNTQLKSKPKVIENIVKAAVASKTVAKLDMQYIPETQRKTVLNSLDSSLPDASEESKKTIREKSASLIQMMSDADIAESINMIIESELIPLTILQDKLTDSVIKAMSDKHRKEFVEKSLEDGFKADIIKKILSNAPLHELADLYETVHSLKTNDNEQNAAIKSELQKVILDRKKSFYQVPGLASTMHKLAEKLDDKDLKDAIEEARPDLKDKPAQEEESKESEKDTSKKESISEQSDPKRNIYFKAAIKILAAVTFTAIATTVSAVSFGIAPAIVAIGAAWFSYSTVKEARSELKEIKHTDQLETLQAQVNNMSIELSQKVQTPDSEHLSNTSFVSNHSSLDQPRGDSARDMPSNGASGSSTPVNTSLVTPSPTPKVSKESDVSQSR